MFRNYSKYSRKRM